MKKSLIALSLLASLFSAQTFASDDFQSFMDSNQIGKIEATMIISIEDRANQLEKIVLNKEANFETMDHTEGKIFAAMVTTVLGDLAEIRGQLSDVSGDQIDAIELRMKELESIVAEF